MAVQPTSLPVQPTTVVNWPAPLDPDTRMPSISQLLLRPDITVIAVPTTLDGCNMSGDDFAVTARLEPHRQRRCRHAWTGAGGGAPLHP